MNYFFKALYNPAPHKITKEQLGGETYNIYTGFKFVFNDGIKYWLLITPVTGLLYTLEEDKNPLDTNAAALTDNTVYLGRT